MKRSRQITGQTDSLDLMLDTLSNVFGGIILISCLLALLPRQQSRESNTIEEQARGKMVERRFEAANEQLADVRTAISDLESKGGESRSADRLRREKLEALVEKLRAGSALSQEARLSNAELEALAATGDPETLKKELHRLQRLAADAVVQSRSILEKAEFLTGRLESLSTELKDFEQGITQQLRFPRERAGRKDPFPVIVWAGGVFPLQTGAKLSSNPAVRMKPIPSQNAVEANPIRGKGLEAPLDDSGFLAALKTIKARDGYVTIYLYPDSHAIFRELKRALFSAGIGYGVEFVPEAQTLRFGSDGTMPPEL